MATTLASLSESLAAVKPLKSDGCGSFMLPEVSTATKTAVEQGTATVALTYAVFKLKTFATISDRQERINAVRQLRVDIKSKGIADMGSSLEGEAARLES